LTNFFGGTGGFGNTDTSSGVGEFGLFNFGQNTEQGRTTTGGAFNFGGFGFTDNSLQSAPGPFQLNTTD
jgi:hypothetical protein